MSNYFEVKFKSEKTNEEGYQKMVSENYIVNALSFTECEARIIKEMESYITGEYEVAAIKKTKYESIIKSANESDDKWFKCKLNIITLDEKTEKEKKYPLYYLVQSRNIEFARKYIMDFIEKTMMDCELVKLEETSIMDVYDV